MLGVARACKTEEYQVNILLVSQYNPCKDKNKFRYLSEILILTSDQVGEKSLLNMLGIVKQEAICKAEQYQVNTYWFPNAIHAKMKENKFRCRMM